MTLPSTWLTALALLLPPSVAIAEGPAGPVAGQADLVVFPPRVSNLDPAVTSALRVAVVDALRASMPGARIVEPEAAAAKLAITGTPEAAARALGAEVWITVGAIRLEGVTEVTLTRHRPSGRPVMVRSPLPATEALPAAARAWVARLMAAPDPEPEPPRGADARSNDRTTLGVRVGGVWSVAASSGALLSAEAELHSRTGRWFMAGSLVGRLGLSGEAEGGYRVAGIRLRSGLYGGRGPWWPAVWLGLEPRVIVVEDYARFAVMPVGGIGVELAEVGGTRLSLDLEVGYVLTGASDADDAVREDSGVDLERPLELAVVVGMAW